MLTFLKKNVFEGIFDQKLIFSKKNEKISFWSKTSPKIFYFKKVNIIAYNYFLKINKMALTIFLQNYNLFKN